MNKKLYFLFFFISFSLQWASAQFPGAIPYKVEGSPLFGKDVIINDDSAFDQKNVSICSAFNGWLYAATWGDNKNSPYISYSIFRSQNNGNTWEEIAKETIGLFWGPETKKISSLKISVKGDSVSNLKVFLGYLLTDSTSGIRLWEGNAFVNKYNGLTGEYEDEIYSTHYGVWTPVAYSFDQAFSEPNTVGGSTSNNFGMLVSCGDWWTGSGRIDCILFSLSSDGGTTVDSFSAIAPNKYFVNVGLSYGKSRSMKYGEFFAVWEGTDDWEAPDWHIYSAHTTDSTFLNFSKPICIDSLDPALTGKCRNPVICCQATNYDNDSAGMTEIILMEKSSAKSTEHDIVGFFNKNAGASEHFTGFVLDTAIGNKIEPSIVFDTYDSTFLVTYNNVTCQKNPMLQNSMNLKQPSLWRVLSEGANDTVTALHSNPALTISNFRAKPAMAWIGKGRYGKGIALFDALYGMNDGIPDSWYKVGQDNLCLYPNPCSSSLVAKFSTSGVQLVKIQIASMEGGKIFSSSTNSYSQGDHSVIFNVSELPQGMYACILTCDEFSVVKKFVKVR